MSSGARSSPGAVRRGLLVAVLVLMAASAVLVLVGETDERTGLGSLAQIWADLVWDVDKAALNLTRLSDREEAELGARIAASLGTAGVDREASDYVSAVGDGLTPFVERTGIEYTFHVLDWKEVNAFAIPGGHVYVSRSMLDHFLQSEAELAAVLGHEMAHVDRRHCVERYQYVLQLEKVRAGHAGALAELVRGFFALGYRPYQEIEADEEGVRIAMRAGYDPSAAASVFDRLQELTHEPAPRRAKTPAGELIASVADMVGSYGRSHPTSRERQRRIEGWVERNRRALSGRTFYRGTTNLKLRIPRSHRELSEERVVY